MLKKLKLTFIGCNLSPLLFSLFINQLGQELNSTGLGIDLGPVNVSAIKFADDIVLVGRNKNSLDKLITLTRIYIYGIKLCNLTSDPNECVIFFSKTGLGNLFLCTCS